MPEQGFEPRDLVIKSEVTVAYTIRPTYMRGVDLPTPGESRAAMVEQTLQARRHGHDPYRTYLSS